ncbi:NAD(P)-dependent oxidoreductase [bacterium LRH843]|nr:NAD(P)-dependent oxidoreductase [bacterium LRH843]
MKVGFIGIGVMGSRMVKQFLDANFKVSVYSRSPEKADPLIKLGAERSQDIATLAQSVDVICTCLSMPSDVQEIYLGEGGILEHAKKEAICVDFTTVGVDTSKEIYQKALDKEIDYLDAPVSGGPEGVEQGTLTIMVGGEESAFATIHPLLNTIGETIQHLGQTGSGSAAKLINQYLVAVHSLAASEAMVTGATLGLDSEQLYQVLKMSYGDSRMLRRHIGSHVLDRQFEPGGAMKYLHKDVKLANQLCEEVGFEQFTGRLAEEALAKAMGQGLADSDMSAVIQPLEKVCDVVVKR